MKVEKSCGCIVIDGRNVLLVKQTKGHWSFPKGHMEEGESEIQTAVREVKEETNVDAIPDETKRYVEEYLMDNGNMKQVIYFVSKQASSNIKSSGLLHMWYDKKSLKRSLNNFPAESVFVFSIALRLFSSVLPLVSTTKFRNLISCSLFSFLHTIAQSGE